ncbi:MAG: peroxiredoxin [Actinomycetota bacterium]
MTDLTTTPLPLQVGNAAPDFSLKDQHGQDFSLSGLAGRAALIVFYPFAFSGICTTELCAIRDDLSAFDNDAVQVLGISCDPMWTLRAWGEDQGYAFPLLSDFWPHGAVAKQYGVFNENAGFATRGTFLIDATGVLRWSVVNGPGEARDIAAYRDALAAL